jgi:competence protein ComEC
MLSYAAAIAVAVWIRRTMALGGLTQLAPSRPMRWRVALRRSAYAAPALLLAASIGWLAGGSSHQRLQVTMLDVGQGDAILIETPSGRDVLIDGGPGRAVLRGLGDELPWHDRSLDLVVVTHTQADHATGLLDVLARYDVRRIVAAEDSAEPSLLSDILDEAALRESVPLRRISGGSSFDLGDGVSLDVISAASEALEGNDASLVLRLTWRDVSFLLAGDIEAAGERALLESGVDLRSSVLKVAHHGSKTSSTPPFLDAVRPRIAVISSGEDNRFGHPDAGVVRRLDAFADLYNTGRDGAVHFETDGRRLWVDTDR